MGLECDQLQSPPASTKNTVALITGGLGFSTTEIYPPIVGCILPSLPETRFGHEVFVQNDRVILCGGEVPSGASSSCLVLDAKNKRWEKNQVGEMTLSRQYSAAVSVENVGTYIIGGRGVNAEATTDFLAHGATEWVTGPDLPVSMEYPCVVKISELSFCAIYKNDIREYQVDIANPTSSSGWQPAETWPSLQTSRKFNPGCAVIDTNKVIIAGGYGPSPIHLAQSTWHKSSEVLDLATRKITYGGDMTSPRVNFNLATTTLDGATTLFAIGGHSGGGPLDSVEVFHPTNNSWTLAPTTIGERKAYFGQEVLQTKLVCPTIEGNDCSLK